MAIFFFFLVDTPDHTEKKPLVVLRKLRFFFFFLVDTPDHTEKNPWSYLGKLRGDCMLSDAIGVKSPTIV